MFLLKVPGGRYDAKDKIAFDFIPSNFFHEEKYVPSRTRNTKGKVDREKPRFTRSLLQSASSLRHRRAQRSIHPSTNTAKRDVCVYASDTSIERVVVLPNTIPSENDKEASPPTPLSLLSVCTPPEETANRWGAYFI